MCVNVILGLAPDAKLCRLLIRAATRDKFSRRMDSAGRLTGGYSSSLWTAILATDSSSGRHWDRWPNSISLTKFFAETVDVQLTFDWQKFQIFKFLNSMHAIFQITIIDSPSSAVFFRVSDKAVWRVGRAICWPSNVRSDQPATKRSLIERFNS